MSEGIRDQQKKYLQRAVSQPHCLSPGCLMTGFVIGYGEFQCLQKGRREA